MGTPHAAALLAQLLAASAAHGGADAGSGVTIQVRSKNEVTATAIHEAGRAAAARLADPACARVLSEFRDGAGRTLKERLDATGRTAAEQLQAVYFYDGATAAAGAGARSPSPSQAPSWSTSARRSSEASARTMPAPRSS